MAKLYVGADESNHAGKTKGEVVVATFSSRHEDGVVKPFPNKRSSEILDEWLEGPETDYRFTLLAHDVSAKNYSNLSSALPYLVKAYMQQNEIKELEVVKAYLDGRLNGFHKRSLKESLQDFAQEIDVDSFTKGSGRKGSPKRLVAPKVVYVADVLSNRIFRTMTIEQMLSNKRFVPITSSFSGF